MVNWQKFWIEYTNSNIEKYSQKHKNISKDIEKLINKHNYTTILDFGCGPALVIKRLAKKYPKKKFYGWDLSKYIIKKNKKTEIKNIEFNVANLNKFSTKQKFDLVICISVLHYFSKPLAKIKQLLKLVNKNGSLLVNYPNKQYLNYRIKNNWRICNYWKSRQKLLFDEKNIITLEQIKKLGHRTKVIRENPPENKYVQITKK